MAAAYAPIRTEDVCEINSVAAISPTSASGAPRKTSSSVEESTPKRSWLPLFLQPVFLVAISCLYFIMAVVLALLAWYSSRHQGICAVAVGEHYFWNYFPTAVFTLSASVWSQIDYRTKMLMPWHLMASGPQAAQRSVALDYVSDDLLSALFKSVKRKDLPVTVAVIGSVANRLLIVLSAGLFVSSSVDVVLAPATKREGNSFGGLQFNSSEVSWQPVARALAIGGLNLSHPFGTSDYYATEIPPVVNESDHIIGNFAEVDIFFPSITCETGHVDSITTQLMDGGLSFNPDGGAIDPLADAVKIGNTTYPKLPYVFAGADEGFGLVTHGSRQSSIVNMSSSSCRSLTANFEGILGSLTPFLAEANAKCNDSEQRFVFGLAHDEVLNASWTSLVCKTAYKLQSGQMRYNISAPSETERWSVDKNGEVLNKRIGNVTANDIFHAFSTAVKDLSKVNILNMTSPQDDVRSFLNENLLLDTLSKLYLRTTAQIANIYLLDNKTKTFQVGAVQSQERLQIGSYSLWFTEGMLVILVSACLYLGYVFYSDDIVSRDPGSLIGLATILAQSGGSTSILMGSTDGGCSPGPLFYTNRNLHICEDLTEVFRMHTGPGKLPRERPGSKAAEQDCQEPRRHAPVILTIAGRLLIICSAIALSIALEVICETSKANDGFVTTQDNPQVEYAWRFIPVVILVLFNVCFGMLDFEIKTLNPFCNLRRGRAPYDTTMDANYLGYPGPIALWRASTRRQYCVVATSIGVILAPFLSIIASGLYISRPVLETSPTLLHQTDEFFLEAFNDIRNITYQSKGLMAATFVFEDNMKLPQWTFDSFVIPELGVLQTQISPRANSLIQVTIPALEATSNCKPISPSDVTYSKNGDYYSGVGNMVDYWNITFPSLSQCGNDTRYHLRSTFVQIDNEGDFAFWQDRNTELFHCPEYIVVAGHFEKATNISNLTALHCKPYADYIDADVRLTAADLAIDRSSQPSLEESTRRFATTIEIPGISKNLLLPYIASELVPSYGHVDGFFGAITKLGIPLDSLVGPSSIDNLKSAVEYLYPRVFAQVAHQNRIGLNESARPSHKATLLIPNRLRLTENGSSSRALEALLLTMALCVAVTFRLKDMDKILPGNPRSILAIAKLLAGSRLLDEKEGFIPMGAESHGQSNDLLKGMVFSLGWWKIRSDVEEGRGDDGQAGEEGERGKRYGIDVGVCDGEEQDEKYD